MLENSYLKIWNSCCLQSNPDNTDTEVLTESVCINGVFVLSGLIPEM